MSLTEILEAVKGKSSLVSTLDQIANDIFNLFRSRDIIDVVGTANLTVDNIIWAVGPTDWHDVVYRYYQLDGDKIYANHQRNVKLLQVTGAWEGRKMEQYSKMFQTTMTTQYTEEGGGRRFFNRNRRE